LNPLKNLVISQQKKEKSNWINTPNAYQKVEIGDPAAEDARKVTKWVTNSASNGQHPVKIDSSHQFVPLNENAKREFREKQQKMKEYRFQNQLSEGPQSRILDGG
jgi:adducin